MGAKNDDQPNWLEVWETASYANVTEGTVRRWLRDGVLPYSKPGGKSRSRIRIARRDVDALLAASRVEARTGPLAGGR